MSDDMLDWRDKHYAFFQNRECEYFPCHKTNDPDNFSCLFCYCPLYVLGRDCGGNPKYCGGIKDCSDCLVPHVRGNYGRIIDRYWAIVEAQKKLEALKEHGHD